MGNFDLSHVQKCPSDIMSKLTTIYIAFNTNYIISVVIYERERALYRYMRERKLSLYKCIEEGERLIQWRREGRKLIHNHIHIHIYIYIHLWFEKFGKTNLKHHHNVPKLLTIFTRFERRKSYSN